MSSFSGPLFAAAVLLVVSGTVKLVSPDATRVALRAARWPGQAWIARTLGVAEIAIAVAALAVGGVVPAGAVALAYLGFAAFAALLAHRTRGTAACGCFGAASAPVGPIHVATNLVVAAFALGAAVWPSPGIGAAVGETPAAGVPFVVLVLVLAGLVHAALSALPELLEAQGAPA